MKSMIKMALKTTVRGLGALALVAATSGIAMAGGGGYGGGGGVPELDPSATMSAIALMVGGVLMLTDRFRAS